MLLSSHWSKLTYTFVVCTQFSFIIVAVCPDTVQTQNPDTDLCVEATVDIVLNTDDGTIGFDYYTAMVKALEDGHFQVALDDTGSDLTVVTLLVIDKELNSLSPTTPTTPSPTITSRPTGSAAPTSSCFDQEKNCQAWANEDPSQCEANESYMSAFCTKACGLCEIVETTNSPSIINTASPTTSYVPTGLATPFPSSASINDDDVPTPSPTTSITSSPQILSCSDENGTCAEFSQDGECVLTKCAFWTAGGDCSSNPDYMLQNCILSCDACDNETDTEMPSLSPMPSASPDNESNAPAPTASPTKLGCVDENARCGEWAADDECSSNPDYMQANCKLSCDACESEGDDQITPTPPSSCVDENDRCAEWAAGGDCSSNPDYMLENCKLSCDARG